MVDYEPCALDQVPFQGYIPHTCCFPLQSTTSQTSILRVLLAALDVVVKDAPFLAGRVEQIHPGSPWSKIAGPFTQTAKDILSSTDLSSTMDYNVWRSERFDMDKLLDKRPFEFIAPFVLPAPVLRANIAFMVGGAALTMAFHHSAMDATGAARLWAAWAAACRGTTLEGGMTLLPRYHPPPELVGNAALHQAFTAAEPASVAPQSTTRLRFSNASLQRLKKDASPKASGAWISTHDALAALIWMCVARSAGRQDSLALSVILNARARLDPPLPTTYVGNCIYATQVPAPHPTSLADAALAIRAAVTAVDSERLADFAAFVCDAGKKGQRVNEAHARFAIGGPFLVTSSAHMDVLSLDWGDTFGGSQVEHFLIPKQIRPGTCVVLPKDREGTDIILGLEQWQMDAFLTDTELTKYASWDSGYNVFEKRL